MKTIRILYCLIFFIHFNASRANAQTWEQLNDSFHYYFEREDYKQALPIAQKIVDVARNDFGEADQQYATALNNLAYTFYKTGKITEAEENFLECFSVKLRVYEPDDDRCLSTAQMLSDIYKQQQNYKESEKLLTGYLQILSKKNRQQSKAFVYSLFMRGDSYLVLKQEEKAKADFLDVLKNEKEFITDTSLLYGAYEALADLYGDVSDLQKGEAIFLRHTEFCKAVDGDQSEKYVFSLFRLAAFYGRAKQYLQSQRTLDKVVDWYSKNKGMESEEYLSAYNNSMLLLCKLGNYTAADSMMDAQLLRLKSKMGEGTSAFENAVYKAGMIFMQAENHSKAEEYIKKSIALSRQLNNPALLLSRLNALDSLTVNRREERIFILEEMVALHEKHKLLTDSAYATKLLFLGGSYERSGYSDKAVNLVPKMDNAAKKGYKERSNDFIDSRTIIANIYVRAGMLDKADSYYQQSLKLAKEVWKDRKDRYAGLLKKVGQMYSEAGFDKKAEEMLMMARQWMEESQSTDYSDWSSVLYELATVKSTLKKTTEAESAYRAAVNYAKKDTALFYEYIQYALLFAEFFTDNKLFDKADSLYREITGVTNYPGKQSYNVFLSTLSAWGLCKYKSGDTVNSSRIIDSVVQLAHHYYKNNQNWDEGVLFRLSQYYRVTGQYNEAVYYAEKHYQIAALKGQDDKTLFAPRIILLFACLHAGQYSKAEEMIAAMNKSSLKHMLNNLDAFSDAEREKYLSKINSNLHLSNTMLLRNKNATPAFLKESFNELLLLKSLILAENRKLIESVIGGSDTTLQRLYGQWLSTRNLLSREYAKPVKERRGDVVQLEEQAESLQKEMNQKSAFLENRQRSKTISVSDVQSALQEDEAAIEFVSFVVTNERNDSIMYAAHLLLKNNPVPVFIPLCTEKQLQKLFDSAGSTATGMVNRIYRGIDLGTNNTAVYLGKELYNLIWAPLEPHLKGIKKISYTPSRKLFNIAFQALPADSSLLLMDKYEFRQYFSTKQVVLRNEKVRTTTTGTLQPKNIFLFGDASFNVAGKTTSKQPMKNNNTSGFYLPVSRGSDNNVWSALPGTAEEVKKIKRQFELNKVPSKVYTQSAASEENLKALSGNSPQVLHIATHGFFLPEQEKKEEENSAENKNAYTLANDPLLRSGLILAGGNHAWSGKTPVEGMEDGIATAYEISQLNLNNTELVVLSACETALGDVRGSEGVFGLQRAFKMAGVKKMIVSLWQVPDKETAELMTSFYNYWLKGKTTEQAFAQAQSDMRKKYSPYYWAAFVLVE